MIRVGIPPRKNPIIPRTFMAVKTLKNAVVGINQIKCQKEFPEASSTKNETHHQITIFLFGMVANSCLVKTPILQPIMKNKPIKAGKNSIVYFSKIQVRAKSK